MRFFAVGFSTMMLSCAVPALHPAISDVRKYCKDQMDCIDGNRDDIQACTVGIQNERRWARQYGCQGEYAEYVQCLKDDSECNSNYWEADSCDDELGDYRACLYDKSDAYEFEY